VSRRPGERAAPESPWVADRRDRLAPESPRGADRGDGCDPLGLIPPARTSPSCVRGR